MSFLHVRGLADLGGGETLDIRGWCQRYETFLTGLYQARLPWAFIVRGQPAATRIYLGIPQPDGDLANQSHLLAAAFPGCDIVPGPAPNEVAHQLVRLNRIAALTGNPSASPVSTFEAQGPGSQPTVGQLENLLKAMRGTDWAYMVIGQPVPQDQVDAGLQTYCAEEQEAVSAYQRRGSAEENNRPLAKRYVELLRAALEKHQQGKQRGMWDIVALLLAHETAVLDRAMQAAAAAYSGPYSRPQPFCVRRRVRAAGTTEIQPPLTRLTTAEAAALARLPGEELSGYRLRERVQFAVSPPEVLQPDKVAIGTIMDEQQNTGNWFEIGRDDLCMHAFIAGLTGSGKTTTCQYLLRQLWEEHHIPWLVLEPSIKSEYRSLLASPLRDDLRIFTLGDETGVPFRWNPLEIIPNVSVQHHIDGLLTLFTAAFAWVTPMPTVLSLALHRLYVDFGWDFTRGTHPRGCISEVQPTLTDLIEAVERTVDDLGYDAEVTGNIRAGLKTRLSHLTVGGKGLMLNAGSSVPMDYALAKPLVLELGAIGNDEEKAFILGALLLRLVEFRQVSGSNGGRLVHVLLIEEAHRLLHAVPETAGDEVANPRGQAVATLCNMLAEMRAYGEGIIVVDQIPTKLQSDVIKNSNLKVIHRLLAEDDRELVGGCMNLTGPQQRYLTGLSVGQAVVHAQGRETPYLVKIPNHARAHDITGVPPSKA
ncbi:MAG: hypothetical protein NT154_19640, partial [Verrucomicrobia bacterium]|nr:hypothetical protein [Verrucomicrobiota bacterium]